jgi:hypothetical protein
MVDTLTTLILKVYAKRRGILNISPQNLGGKNDKKVFNYLQCFNIL